MAVRPHPLSKHREGEKKGFRFVERQYERQKCPSRLFHRKIGDVNVKRISICLFIACLSFPLTGIAKENYEEDTIQTSDGDLKITFLGHATLMFTFQDKIIHIDPVSREADYTRLPRADLILITHEHGDHLDPAAIRSIRTDETVVVLTQLCAEKVQGGIVMKNGDEKDLCGLHIRAVPAYNIVHKQGNGQPFHPKGTGNGYVIQFGDKRVYVAGDTENIPEMKKLEEIDIAFLPMNLPFTMTPEMVAEAAQVFKPKILYPYHYGDTDTGELLRRMKDIDGIEVRIRNMK